MIRWVIDLIVARGFPNKAEDLGHIGIGEKNRHILLELQVSAEAFDPVEQFVGGIAVQLAGCKMVCREEEACKEEGENRGVQKGQTRAETRCFHDSLSVIR